MTACLSPEELQLYLRTTPEASARTDVAQHLATCGTCQQRLAQLTEQRTVDLTAPGSLQQEAPTIASLDTKPPAPAPARLNVPGYEILSELGRGGMGVVYKARQIKVNRLVALKMILANQHADLHDKVRFQIEAEAVARLHHPHIVQLYEVGEHDGLPFFSLEFCAGGTLERRLRAGRLAVAQATALVEKLARAMAYAHVVP